MQIRKKLGISVGAFNLWWRQQKSNGISEYLTITFCSKKVDDLLIKTADLYHLLIKWGVRGGGEQNRSLPYDYQFVCELSSCGFESRCSHLNFRYHACFEQGVPWHSDKYGVWIHSGTCTWHGKSIQSIGLKSKTICTVKIMGYKISF